MQDGCFLCKRNLSLSIRGSLCWPGWRCFQNACLAAKELLKASNCFTLKNNSPKKLAKAASSGGNFAILVHSLVQHLAWGPLRQSGILLARFGRPKPVGPSYPLEQEKSQLRVWAVLHARFLCLVWYILTFLLQFVVFNEDMRCWSTGPDDLQFLEVLKSSTDHPERLTQHNKTRPVLRVFRKTLA